MGEDADGHAQFEQSNARAVDGSRIDEEIQAAEQWVQSVPQNFSARCFCSDGPKPKKQIDLLDLIAPKESPDESNAARMLRVSNTFTSFGVLFGIPLPEAGEAPSDVRTGEFSITDWSGYPEGVPRPAGTVRLLEGDEYLAARQAANSANAAVRREAGLVGDSSVQVHEIQPVKFAGSPTDLGNKAILKTGVHAEVTVWWNRVQSWLVENF